MHALQLSQSWQNLTKKSVRGGGHHSLDRIALHCSVQCLTIQQHGNSCYHEAHYLRLSLHWMSICVYFLTCYYHCLRKRVSTFCLIARKEMSRESQDALERWIKRIYLVSFHGDQRAIVASSIPASCLQLHQILGCVWLGYAWDVLYCNLRQSENEEFWYAPTVEEKCASFPFLQTGAEY